MSLVTTLIEKRVEKTLHRLINIYGFRETTAANSIFQHALSELYENAVSNSLSMRKMTACFVELIQTLNQILAEVKERERIDLKN